MKNACYKCADREVGCHQNCEVYRRYKDKLEDIRKKKKKYVENLEPRICSDHWGYDKRGKK